MILYYVFGLILLALLYLWHTSRALYHPPPEAAKLASKRWSRDEILDAYKQTEQPQRDTTALLGPKQSRRYIVVGGSGLVGGWITRHLLQRGESPSAIRILDIQPPKQPLLANAGIEYIKTDVTSSRAVDNAFAQRWPPSAANLPLTVFHCVAFIRASDRYAAFLAPYLTVNVEGARHVFGAAKAHNCTAFIATSSASIAIRPPSFFPWPWTTVPHNHFQLQPNADPVPNYQNAPLSSYGGCYAYSKAQMEYFVLSSTTSEMPTGCIRPGHAIYGTGVENPSSLSYDYLRRGGNPTWIPENLTQFVDAQNVSAAHLALEAKLLDPKTKTKVSGQAYLVTDPNPPVTYGHLYSVLKTAAHPKTPIHFAHISAVPILLAAYVFERYEIIRKTWLGMSWLPPLEGDLALLQPAMFNMSTLNILYDDKRIREELDFHGVIGTLEGLCRAVREWNDKVEAREKLKGAAGVNDLQDKKESVVPPVKM